MSHIRALAAVAALVLSASSHAQGTPTPGTDPSTPPPAVETPTEPYFIVTRVDARKCAYPVCGGYFVKAVNSALTRCADGKLAKECHAVELDTESGKLVLVQDHEVLAVENSPLGDFDAIAERVLPLWLPRIAGKSFRVRVKRKGAMGPPIPPHSLTEGRGTLSIVLIFQVNETGRFCRSRAARALQDRQTADLAHHLRRVARRRLPDRGARRPR